MKNTFQAKFFLPALAIVLFLSAASAAKALIVSPDPLGALSSGCSIAVSGGPTMSGTVQWSGADQKKYCDVGDVSPSTPGTSSLSSSAALSRPVKIYNAFAAAYPDAASGPTM